MLTKLLLQFLLSWCCAIIPLYAQGVAPSAPDTTLVKQSIRYYAPEMGEVYLVWRPLNRPVASARYWNENTKLTDSLLYTLMEVKEDTFFVELSVLENTQIYTCFWNLKNVHSVYLDHWDINAEVTKFVTATPASIVKKRSKIEQKTSETVITVRYVWKLVLLLAAGYVGLWLLSRWVNRPKAKSHFYLIAAAGLGLALMHLPARLEIMGLHPRLLWHYPKTIGQLVTASHADFKFSLGVTAVILAGYGLARSGSSFRRYLYYAFIALSTILAVVAYTNIMIVNHLGGPLTYQWLYYADFLGGAAALTSINANFSSSNLLNLGLYVMLFPLLGGILKKTVGLFFEEKNAFRVLMTFFVLVTIGSGIQQRLSADKTPAAQRANAVLAYASSVLEAENKTSFFSEEIPGDSPFYSENFTPLEPSIALSTDSSRLKNIVFIVLESAGANYFDAYGGHYGISPNLDGYADRALRFENAYATVPSSNRSLVSLTCGIYPYPSYQSLTQEKPSADIPSLSSVLKPLGYRTSFFSSADFDWQNCLEFLHQRQFDVVEDYRSITCQDQFRTDEKIYKESGGIDDLCITDRFSEWLTQGPGQPFFSILWTIQGHYPYYFGGKEIDYGVNNVNFNRYLNALRHDDEVVGQVMSTLEARGLDSTTLVVVVGDHGEAFGHHGQYGHGNTIYEENLRVPLYFINPLIFKGETRGDLVSLKDIPSTALSLIGVNAPPEWQGRDLIRSKSQEVFSLSPFTKYYFGYRRGPWKYIFNESDDKLEVFNLHTDPLEKDNLANLHPRDSIEYARRRVASWVQHQKNLIENIDHDE